MTQKKQNQQKIQLGLYLKPKQGVSNQLLNDLKQINAEYSKNKKFACYAQRICKLFQVTEITNTPKNMRFYLGGFLEGEASLNLGAKKNNTSKFKVFFDPEFNITQHVNGIQNLYLALMVFQTGRIRYKSGSLATFVFTIDNRQALKEKVLPFYDTYVTSYGSSVKAYRVMQFKKLLQLFDQKAHLDYHTMINQIVPLWSSLRMQIHSNATFRDAHEAKQWITNAYCDQNHNVDLIKSSETNTSS